MKRLAVLLVLVCAARSLSEAPDWKAVATRSKRPIALAGGHLSGEGFDALLGELAGSQFVLLGEAHNAAEIPPFTTALFAVLHERFGYDYAALEQDPLMMERVSTAPARGDLAAIAALARRYPYGFTFVSDEELAMLARLGALSTGKSEPIWGCEQAFGATHYLEELAPLAPPEARGRVDALLGRARQEERPTRDLASRHFMSRDAERSGLLAALAGAWKPAAGSRAAFLLGALRESDAIYGYYNRAKAGEIVGLYNNTVREALMKDCVSRQYRAAERKDGRAPKVLLKYGHIHAQRGRSAMNAFDVGNFVSDVATFNGRTSYAIAILHYDTPAALAASTPVGAFLAPLAPSERWELLDLRPLQPYVHARKLDADIPEDARASVRDFLFGFDAVLFVPHGRHGTYTVTGAAY